MSYYSENNNDACYYSVTMKHIFPFVIHKVELGLYIIMF